MVRAQCSACVVEEGLWNLTPLKPSTVGVGPQGYVQAVERGGVVRRRQVLRREAPTQQYLDRGRRGWEEWETRRVGLIFVADLTGVTKGLKAWGDAV